MSRDSPADVGEGNGREPLMWRSTILLGAALIAGGCALTAPLDDQPDTGSSDADSDGDSDMDVDSDSDMDVDSDSDSDVDADSDSDVDCEDVWGDRIYDEVTCSVDDPCGWSNDGYCDAYCTEMNIDTDMFDDGADCGSGVACGGLCDVDATGGEPVYVGCTCGTGDPCGWADNDTCDEACIEDGIVGEMFDDHLDCCAPAQSYLGCGVDGDVHWFDNCGLEGALALMCSANEVCDDGGCACAPGYGGATCAELPTDCTGLPDFTLCFVVSGTEDSLVSDFSFDICVDGVCVSPGCGDASCNTPSPHFPTPDTNQRTCYDLSSFDTDSEADAGCPAEGEDFHGQDAQYGWDTAHDEGERFTRDTALTGHPVVTDNVTGLVWQGCMNGLSGDDCGTGTAATLSWQSAMESCDTMTWAGRGDWRLPDVYELASLTDSSTLYPSIDSAAFPNTPAGGWGTWTSSAVAVTDGVNYHWYTYEQWLYYMDESSSASFRCVRGGPMTARTLAPSMVGSDRIVTDSLSGLTWQGCVAGESGEACATGVAACYSWKNALAYCEGLSYAGHDDWRVPNTKELQTLVDTRVTNPCIDADAFPETPADLLTWTSTTNLEDMSSVVAVDFNAGGLNYQYKSSPVYVRCVRGGS
jgi:hypothetical protein